MVNNEQLKEIIGRMKPEAHPIALRGWVVYCIKYLVSIVIDSS